MNIDELETLARAAAEEAEGDWFCPDLLENHTLISSSLKARRFMHAATPEDVLKLIAIARAAAQYMESESHANWTELAALRKALAALKETP